MPPLPTPRARSPNFQAFKTVRSRSPANTPSSAKPRSHSLIKINAVPTTSTTPATATIADVQTTITESGKSSDFEKTQSNTTSTIKETKDPNNSIPKHDEDLNSRIEICIDSDKIQEKEPRSISPLIEKSYRCPYPTFKLGSTGHVTSASVSSAPGSISPTPLNPRRTTESAATEEVNPQLTRTDSSASNLSNLSQSAHDIFMSISSDLTGLATQSSYAFDEFFGIDQGKIFYKVVNYYEVFVIWT